ncbi:MAG: helix-turn-helix transcriptional regulator [Yoonia sp.]
MQRQSELSSAAYDAKQGQSVGNQIFVTGPQVQARYQKSHVTIWRWMNDAKLDFPKPIQINRLNYWRLSDLEKWEAAQQSAA